MPWRRRSVILTGTGSVASAAASSLQSVSGRRGLAFSHLALVRGYPLWNTARDGDKSSPRQNARISREDIETEHFERRGSDKATASARSAVISGCSCTKCLGFHRNLRRGVLRAIRCQGRAAVGSRRGSGATLTWSGKRAQEHTHLIRFNCIIVRHARRSFRKCDGENAS